MRLHGRFLMKSHFVEHAGSRKVMNTLQELGESEVTGRGQVRAGRKHEWYRMPASLCHLAALKCCCVQ